MAFQLTKEQEYRIEQARSKAQDLIRSEIQQFYKNIDILLAPKAKKEYNFWDSLSVFPSVGYDLLKGAFDGIVGVGQTINVLIANFGNDIAHMFDGSDGTSWDKDALYAIGNLGIGLTEGLAQFAVSTTANLGRVFQTLGHWEADLFENLGWDKLAKDTRTGAEFFNPEWAFGKGGVSEDIAKHADQARVGILQGDFNNQSLLANQYMFNSPEQNQQIVDDRYYDGVANWLKGSVEVQNFIEEKITDPTAHAIFGKGKDKATEMYGDEMWYQTLSGVSNSVGNILAMWGVSAVAKSALGKTATVGQIKAVGTTYFFSSTFGKMYQEAINNGAGLNDAYTFALGNAMMETLLEQTGGFKAGENPTGIFKRLKEKGITGIFKDAFDEGLEEVYSELGGTGFGTYNNGIEQVDNKDFYGQVMMSFFSGAGSSFGLGLARNAVYNMTVNTKTKKFYDAYKQDVKKVGEEKALETLNKRLEKIVDGLNGRSFGMVENENGVARLTTMDQQQKQDFIKNNGLTEFITQKEDGTFGVNKFDAEIFYNRVDTGKQNQDGTHIYERAQEGLYAVNNNVQGVDITNGGQIQPSKMSELTELGKRALDVANQMDVPVVVYKGDAKDTGGYGKNGVMYINENSLDDNNVEKTIIKHEIVHAIADTNSEAYKALEQEVDNLVSMNYQGEGKFTFTYKNDTFKKMFRNKGLESVILNQMEEYIKQNNNAEESIRLGKEEVVAYFMENIIEDSQISYMLAKTNPKLLDKLIRSFDKDENLDVLAEGNKKVARQIKSIKKQFERAVADVVEEKKTIGYIIKNRTKEKLLQKFLKETELAEKERVKRVNALTKSAIPLLVKLSPDKINVKEANKKFKEDHKFRVEVITKIEELYQEKVDNDTVTEELKQDFEALKTLLNDFNKPAQETTAETTKEGFNVIQKRKFVDPSFLKESVIRDENGELKVMYHGTPQDFGDFSDEFIGTNTSSGNTVYGHFFTDAKGFAERFKDIKEEGNKGILYEVYLDIRKPITHPYSIWVNDELTLEEKNKIVLNYVKATNGYEGFVEYASELLAEEDREYSDDLAYEVWDMVTSDLSYDPFEGAQMEKEALIENGYDGMYYYEGREEQTIYNPKNPKKPVVATIAFSAEQVYVIKNDAVEESVEERTIGDDKVNERTFKVSDKSYIQVWDASDISGQRNSVVDFNVEESQRRQGIGSRLIKEVIDYYGDNISAQVSNPTSLRAFYKNGFRYTGDNSLSLEQTLDVFSKSPESINMEYVKPTSNIVQKRAKIVDANVSDEGREFISKVFGDAVLAEFFEVNKKGEYVLKNSKVTAQSNKQNTVMFNGQKYRSTEYGVNAYNEVANADIDLTNYRGVSKVKPLKLTDMNEGEKMLHTIFSTTRLNYILYRETGSNTLGFSVPTSKANVVFINTYYLSASKDSNGDLILTGVEKIADTMIHEHVHEAFKYAKLDAFSYAYEFANVMFKPINDANGKLIKVEPTEAWKEFDKFFQYGSGGFIGYLYNNYYKGKTNDYTHVHNEMELYQLLTESKTTNDSKKQRTINEVTAQITGHIFSSQEVYRQVLQGKTTLKFKMYELYDKLMNSTGMEANVKAFLKNAYKQYATLFDAYMKEIAKIFPQKEKYTLPELNTFIETFTEGKYTTKAQLLKDYFAEKANKKRGEASITVDNIIYIASMMGSKVKNAIESYKNIVQEFKLFKTQVETLITNPEAVLIIDDVTAIYKRIKKADVLVRVFNKKYTGQKQHSLDEYTFNQIRDQLDLLQDKYNSITDEVISMFNLPSRQEVADALQMLDDAIDDAIDQIYTLGSVVSIAVFDFALNNFSNTLSGLGKSSEINANIFGAIKQQQTALRKANIKNLLMAIDKSIKNADVTLRSIKRTTEANMNQEYRTLYGGYQDANGVFHEGIINRIYNTIKEYWNDYPMMKKEIGLLLEEMSTLIQGSQVVGNELSKTDGFIEGDQIIKTKITAEIAQLKDHLINELLNEIYDQFAFLFQDKQFAQKQYPSMEKYKHLEINELVKEFKESKIANNLSTILKEFHTVYEIVFGNGESLNDYAKKNHDQVQTIDKQLNTKGMDTIFVKGLPPQEILGIYIKITEGNMEFFKDFFREYKKATFMKEKVLATYHRTNTAWQKSHKDNVKKSLEEVEVDSEFFIRMSKTQLTMIKNKAKAQNDVIRSEINTLTKDKKALEIKRKGINKEISEKEAIKKKSSKGQPDWDKAQARIRTLKAEKDAIIKQEKDLKKEITLKKETIRLNDDNVLIKDALIKHAEDNKKKGIKQTIQRGHIVSLYLSVMREMEMHEMVENGDMEIKPTNHFAFGNQINLFDNQALETRGYKYAKSHTIPFTIFTETREDLLEYLESLLTEQDLENIEFANSVFDTNYEFANEMYKAKYLVDLPRQKTYIPFSTANADKTRELELKRIQRHNLGVDRGFVLKTTLGASETLQIENIFSVMDSHTKTVGQYSYDRLNTDWQNLLVNKSGGNSFQELLNTEDSIFGATNGIETNINTMLMNVAQYSDTTESVAMKYARKILRNTVRAVIGLAIPMYIKQYLSMMTISSKTKINFLRVLKGTSQSARMNNKYFKYLIENNDNFYFRSLTRFIPNLSDYASVNIFGYKSKFLNTLFKSIDKVSDAMTIHVGRADARVLVGTFRAKAEEIRSKNPQLSEDQVLAQANQWMTDEVLLYGVANTNPAFRSDLSNSKKLGEQIIGKFQSENLIHYGSIVRNIMILRNGHAEQYKMLSRDLLAFLLSGIFSALVNEWWSGLMGYNDNVGEEDEIADFIFNEFIWNNLVGSIPYLNQITQMIEFDFGKEDGLPFKMGFEPRVPLLSELGNIFLDLTQIRFGDNSNVERKLYEIVEEISHMLGIPIKNARKIAQIIGSTMGEYGSERGRELDRLFNNKTRTIAYYDAIREGNQNEIRGYVEDRFNNIVVQNELVRLNMKSDGNDRIKIYDESNFRAMDENGKYITYEIPETVGDKYKNLTQQSLIRLIRSSEYRRLPDHHKAKMIQRVINYYYNYMKQDILFRLKKADRPVEMSSIQDVASRSIQYAMREFEEEKRRK